MITILSIYSEQTREDVSLEIYIFHFLRKSTYFSFLPEWQSSVYQRSRFDIRDISDACARRKLVLKTVNWQPIGWVSYRNISRRTYTKTETRVVPTYTRSQRAHLSVALLSRVSLRLFVSSLRSGRVLREKRRVVRVRECIEWYVRLAQGQSGSNCVTRVTANRPTTTWTSPVPGPRVSLEAGLKEDKRENEINLALVAHTSDFFIVRQRKYMRFPRVSIVRSVPKILQLC